MSSVRFAVRYFSPKALGKRSGWYWLTETKEDGGHFTSTPCDSVKTSAEGVDIPHDAKLFDKAEEPGEFMKTWAGHPYWARRKPTNRYKVVVVIPVLELKTIGYRQLYK